jgi:hypothetical protein
MSYASAWTSLRTSWESLQDPDLSGWEKFETVLTSLSMTIPMLVMGMQALNVETIKNTMATLSNALAKKIYNIAVKSNIISTGEESEEID